MEQPISNDNQTHNPAAETVKKKYHAPELAEYGNVAKLTQSTGSANGDGGLNMMTPAAP